jgi:hypothetical protein
MAGTGQLEARILGDIMFRYYNVHPRKLSADDCTKRSISLTTGISYREVARGMNEHKKITGVKVFYENPNPRSYMERVLGFTRVTLQKSERVTVESFAKEHPHGRYVVSVSGHWTACIDGIVYDTWDCTDQEVLSYYEITEFIKTKVEKKYCFTVKYGQGDVVFITIYDGNGMYATKELAGKSAKEYIENLYERGFFNFDEMGEYI